jgi:hypothetical protein
MVDSVLSFQRGKMADYREHARGPRQALANSGPPPTDKGMCSRKVIMNEHPNTHRSRARRARLGELFTLCFKISGSRFS